MLTVDKPAKLSLRELRDGMRVFLKFPSVETRIMEEVRNRMASILMHGVSNGGRPREEVLCDYLDGDLSKAGPTNRRACMTICKSTTDAPGASATRC